jgi:GT2 family glycosyltransferase
MVPGQEAIRVVVPSWRGRQHLETLLPSLAAQTLPPANVLIVDGNSNDGSSEIARQFGVSFLQLDRNAGFAAAVNAGIARCPIGARVAVLNNDLRLAPDWLEKASAIEAPFVVGKVFQWDSLDILDAAWDELSLGALPLRAGHGCRDGAFWNIPRGIRLAPWTAILLERSYWQDVGGLDETFESYLEDVDFGLRSASLGYEGRYEPSAVCWHRGSATLGASHPRQIRLTARNQWKLIGKHGGSEWLRSFAWKVFAGQVLSGIAASRRGGLSAWLQGKWEARHDVLSQSRCDVKLLTDLEQSLRGTQSHAGIDRFWKLYWSLT